MNRSLMFLLLTDKHFNNSFDPLNIMNWSIKNYPTWFEPRLIGIQCVVWIPGGLNQKKLDKLNKFMNIHLF